MISNHDEHQSSQRRLSILQVSLEYHDRHYAARHTPESTQIRAALVREIQALEQEIGAAELGEMSIPLQ
jgi:hypothetical protein